MLCTNRDNSLEILDSSISPKRMGIKFDDKGEIVVPKYFFPLRDKQKDCI